MAVARWRSAGRWRCPKFLVADLPSMAESSSWQLSHAKAAATAREEDAAFSRRRLPHRGGDQPRVPDTSTLTFGVAQRRSAGRPWESAPSATASTSRAHSLRRPAWVGCGHSMSTGPGRSLRFGRMVTRSGSPCAPRRRPSGCSCPRAPSSSTALASLTVVSVDDEGGWFDFVECRIC